MKEFSPELLYEDNHLLAIYKPAGMLSQSDITRDYSAVDWVRDYLRERYDKPGNVFVGLCHRLDRPVSGILLFAKTSKASERLQKMFQKNEIHKTYWAISDRRPSSFEGHLTQFLLKDEAKNRVQVVSADSRGAKVANTRYKLLKSLGNYCLLELNPDTGRSHQLRLAMKSLNAPILGDLKYGGSPLTPPTIIALHHRTLTFIHPVQKSPLTIEAMPKPEEPWFRFVSMR